MNTWILNSMDHFGKILPEVQVVRVKFGHRLEKEI